MNIQPAPPPNEVAIAAYVDLLDIALPGMGSTNPPDREPAENAIEKLCMRACGPGHEEQRRSLCAAMGQRLGPDVALPARVWLLRKLEPMGRDEVVDTLAQLLHDDEPRVRELARRALQNNPAPFAGSVLRTELGGATDPTWQVALINALAWRQDERAVPALVELSRAKEPAVAQAAIAGLGKIAAPTAVDLLTDLRTVGPAAQRADATAALLQAAQRLRETGRERAALRVYEELFQPRETMAVRVAALRGLAAVQGDKAVPLLVRWLGQSAEPRLRYEAARCAQELPGERATGRFADAWAGADADAQALLLDVLSARAQRYPAAEREPVRTVVRAGLRSPTAAVRLAAIEAAGAVGDASMVRPVAQCVATGATEEQSAGRDALAAFPGAGVDEALEQLASSGEPGPRAVAIRALQARGSAGVVAVCLGAVQAEDEAVQRAAWEALGALADFDQAEAMVQALLKVSSDGTRTVAEPAVAAVCSRRGDRELAVEPVVQAVLRQPTAEQQASLIRVLGRVQGQAALMIVRVSCQAPGAPVRDAAIRALAEWQDEGALMDLLELATGATEPAQRVLALRGYVRLLRASTSRTPAQVVTMLSKAMVAAERDEERRLVLAGWGDRVCIEALDALLPYVNQGDLRVEAASAVIEIAPGLSVAHRDRALAALEQAAGVGHEATAARALEALDYVRTHLTAWRLAGPYSQEDVKGADLLAVEFAPEKSLLSALESPPPAWQTLSPRDAKQPWRIDLDALAECRQCAAYAYTELYVDEAQAAELRVGSDDGVKVWLDGAPVHENAVARGLTCDEDRVAVELQAGWNPLLVKVTQGTGDWGLCVSLYTPAGKPIPNLRCRAEP